LNLLRNVEKETVIKGQSHSIKIPAGVDDGMKIRFDDFDTFDNVYTGSAALKYSLNDFNSFKFKLILNQLRKQDNTDLGTQICKIIKKHLGINVIFTGNIAYDEHVHDAICQRVCFLDRYPHTRAANDLRELNRKMSNSLGEQLMLNYL